MTERQGPIPSSRRGGFIVFCEKRLCYRSGLKAWLFLGPYFLGALVLDILVDPVKTKLAANPGPWIGFLAYIVLYPVLWRRISNVLPKRKVAST